MGVFDIALRYLAGNRPEDMAWLLLRADPGRVVPVPSNLDHVRREVDFACRIERPEGDPFILHGEFELDADAGLSSRLLQYAAMLHGREGLPVVSTRAAGVEELLGPLADDQTVAIGDSDGFVDRMIELLQDPARALALGSENRQRAARCFSLGGMIEEYQNLYTSLLV